MKKLAAILLMAVFMFNLFGYKLWVYYAGQYADKKLEAAVNNNQYDNDGLVLIKKQVNLPYYNNTDEYTMAEGEVEINGVFYKYVKYRIHNNQLELLCLPNAQKTSLQKAKHDYFSVTTDIQGTGKNKAPENNSLKKSFSDFEVYAAVNLQPCQAQIPEPYPVLYFINLGLLHKAAAEQPPDRQVA